MNKAQWHLEDDLSFEPWRGNRLSRDHNPKVDRATQSKMDRLEEQVERLSQTNLALTGLLKRTLHWAPDHLKREYHDQWEAIKGGKLDEV